MYAIGTRVVVIKSPNHPKMLGVEGIILSWDSPVNCYYVEYPGSDELTGNRNPDYPTDIWHSSPDHIKRIDDPGELTSFDALMRKLGSGETVEA